MCNRDEMLVGFDSHNLALEFVFLLISRRIAAARDGRD